MNDQTNVKVGYVSPLKRICMTIGELPTSYLDTMTYYEMLLWFTKYLKETLIPTINNNAEAVTELQNLYEELRIYVNDYFDNLDVQDEIDNKLDEMAESGQLTDIIAQYLGLAGMIVFDNVASMKLAENLVNGSKCATLGYYSVNDGGNAFYKIRTKGDSETADEMFKIAIGNNLIADLIFDSEVNIKQIGARSQSKENTKYDIKNYIDAYVDKQNELKKQFKLYIPFGIWHTSGNLFYGKQGLYIYGDENFAGFYTHGLGTVITSYNNNQDYIFRVGNSSNDCHNWVLKNLTFSSAEYAFDNNTFVYQSLKSISKALELHYAEYGITDNLFFYYISGNCLSINASWENYFKLLNFRKVSDYSKGIINIETVDTSLTETANITANTFEKIMFERVHGNLINFESNCRFYNNHLGVINVEPNQLVVSDEEYTKFTDDNIGSFNDGTATHFSIFNLEDSANFAENVIESIELNNFGSYYFTHNSNTYVYDTICKMGNNVFNANLYNNIASNGGYKEIKVIYLPSTVTSISQYTNYSTFGNFITDQKNGFMFDVNGLPGIFENNSVLTGVVPATYHEPSQSIFQNGNWIPCYKTKPNRAYNGGTGLGALFYDKDSYNNLKLIVKPRTENNNLDRGIFSTVVNPNRKLALRAKVPNGETVRIYLNDLDTNDSVALDCVGDGTYKIYEADFTSSQNVGDKILATVASNTSYQRNISCDVFISV